MEKVYAGGDIVLGAATVILAMGEGRRAAAGINEFWKKSSRYKRRIASLQKSNRLGNASI